MEMMIKVFRLLPRNINRVSFCLLGADGAMAMGAGYRDQDRDLGACVRVDPKRHVTACVADCCDGGLTSFQPAETAMLKKLRKKQGDRYRYFSPSWYSTYPWLTVCVTQGKVFCVVCHYCSQKHLLGLAKKGDDAFILSGFDNWKKPVRDSIHMPCLTPTKKLF